ncbi:MAG: cache domain-containing protein, partial [Caldilineaceae bacterium]|nr:cache domain-containing protein [Caldilineaceae bacterium]
MFNSLFTKRSLSLTSLRVQLLLWVSLPAAVLLLAVSLTGVRGHEQAMQRLVQERADGLVQASAALIRLRLDRTHDALRQLAGDLAVQPVGSDILEMAITATASNFPPFSGGLALYHQLGGVSTSTATASWPERVEVRNFVAQLRAGNSASTLALYDSATNEWLLLQGVAVAAQTDKTAFVLVGAMPLASLDLSNLIQPLSLRSTAEIHVEDASGNILIDLI